MQLEGNKGSKYYTRDKFMNDYSALFGADKGNNVTGWFNTKKYQENLYKYSI